MFDLGVDLVAASFPEVVAFAEHAVEFVDEKRDGFVALVGLNGGVHVGAVDLDVAFGREPVGDGGVAVAFQLHADTDDPILVTKQSLGFLAHERFKGRSELEMNA